MTDHSRLFLSSPQKYYYYEPKSNHLSVSFHGIIAITMKILQSVLPLSLLSLLSLALAAPSHQFTNPRLQNAFIALQAWKKAMTSDPHNFTSNWHGPNVCSYNGVFCAPVPDDSYIMTVAGIDLNHANIAGTLPKELGLLTDLALFHLNSNRFSGAIPYTLKKWTRIFELDVSNNKFYGGFPNGLLCLPSLKFLDLRYNYFEGPVPSALFDLKLDALFLNNNKFKSKFPKNIGNVALSYKVIAVETSCSLNCILELLHPSKCFVICLNHYICFSLRDG